MTKLRRQLVVRLEARAEMIAVVESCLRLGGWCRCPVRALGEPLVPAPLSFFASPAALQ